MKHIYIFCHKRWFNAVAGYALETGYILAGQGYKVVMIVQPGSPLGKKITHSVFEQIEVSFTSPIRLISDITRLIRQNRRMAGHLLVFTSNGALLGKILRFFVPGLRVYRFRGDATPPKSHVLSKWAYSRRFSDGLLFPSEYAKSLCQPVMDAKMPTAVIPYPLANGDIKNNSNDREFILRKYKLPTNHKIYCLLGRNQAVKGHADLIKAFARAQLSNAHLIFLIKKLDEFPDELLRMKRLIQENDMQDKITILGPVDNLSEILSVVDVGVIPSLGSEAICRVAVEFFACSVPVIAYPVGSLPETIRHQYNGFLCSQINIEALTEQLVCFDRLSEEDMLKMRTQAQQTYLNEHSSDVFFNRLKAFIRLT